VCLSIPSRVEKIDENNMATVDTMGVKRDISLDLMNEDVQVGDYILIHVGFAMNKIDKAEAEQSLKVYEEMVQAMQSAEDSS